MPAVRRPLRGSRAFYPRKRASRIYPRITSWPASNEVKPLGFAGYKAGMTHVMIIDANPNSKTKGQAVFRAVTVLDCPPLQILGFKCYSKTGQGLKDVATIVQENPAKELARKWGIVKIKPMAEQLQKLHGKNVSQVRLLIHTKPGFKSKPEVFEMGIGGTADKQLEWAKGMVGKELKASDVLKPGDYVDAFAISRGRGFKGPVARFGVRILGRKFQQMHRHTGSLGTTEPAKIRPTVPAAGQHGFQGRMEWNKRVVKVGGDAKDVTPSNHFLRYGVLRGEPVLIEGSLPGPAKRLIRLRAPLRQPKSKYPADIRAVSTESKQGVCI